MTGTDAGSVVAVEVLVEEQVIPPERIVGELRRAAVERAAAALVAQEDSRQSLGQPLRDLVERRPVPRSGRILHPEARPIVGVVVDERLDEERVDRHPDRAAPVRVSAEEATVRLGRQVSNLDLLAVDVEGIRVLEVVTRERPNPERAEEFVLIEHVSEHPTESFLAEQREQPAVAIAGAPRVVDVADQMRPMAGKPAGALLQLGEGGHHLLVDRRGGAERKQADDRTNLQLSRLPIGGAQDIVEESVLLVPHLPFATDVDHG